MQGVVLPVEYPQVQAYIAGSLVCGVVFLEIENVGYFAADRFRIGFAIASAPSMTVDFFSGVAGQEITIQAGLEAASFVTVFVGKIDEVDVDFYQNSVVLCGRDLSCRLIDAEVPETFVNQTASQIAIKMAENFGLTPMVSGTSKFVGQYYEIDHARTVMSLNSRNMTGWDLLSNLAKSEGFVLYVRQTDLFFGPVAVTSPATFDLTNFSDLLINYISGISEGVTVKSWNTRRKVAVVQTAGKVSFPVIVRPNLSGVQAADYASTYLTYADQQKIMMTGRMPLDFVTMPGNNFLLTGTNSSFDQIYTIDRIRRRLGGGNGCFQSIRAYAGS
jgi:hypothetical protein